MEQDTSIDVNNLEGGVNPSCTSVATDVLPEAKPLGTGDCSDTGVSTHCMPERKEDSGEVVCSQTKHWYALRTTYGREKKAYEYIVGQGGTAFYPTSVAEKLVNGKKKLIEVSLIKNMFFAYGTEDEIKLFVYDNHNLPYLRFYYKRIRVGSDIMKTPLIVPEGQMKSFQIICGVDASKDVLMYKEEIKKFQTGERVRVVAGDFEGVEGIVARFSGQQRVGIVINGVGTIVTAYIPNGCLEHVVKHD